ncbi:polysaccharide lyase family protein [Flexivirga meconopsidis]|uniref:polysaccharide lyase family protein n=1 Tax=Flexivirga meconopsidis TaxID=2977121 RepID=UPI00223F480D|nr:polysaccharide lyase family protein [Flexivirga meconopsidis]
MALAPHGSSVPAVEEPRPLRAVGDVGSVRLTWREVPGASGYRVHGVATPGSGTWRPDDRNLLTTHAQPRFVHDGLGPLAANWSYAVVPVLDHPTEPLGTVTASTRTSVTVTGDPVATVGSFDGSGLELALAPTGFVHYRSTFPRDVDFRYGYDRADVTWSYLQPGPDDAWAGRRGHRFRLRFDLDQVPDDDLDFALWLVDRHATRAGSATVVVNGGAEHTIFFDDPVTGDRIAAAEASVAVPGLGGGPAYIERPVDRATLQVGENTIDVVKDHGSWIAYDAVGVFARR